MVTAKFLWKALTIPAVVLKTALEYYTTGTVYSTTSSEFVSSLWKNIHMAVIYHLSGAIDKENIRLFVYTKMDVFVEKYRSSKMVAGMAGYGTRCGERLRWIVKNNGPNVLVFLHGGGYMLNVFESQYVQLLALYHALPEATRSRLSIVILEYSLTIHDHTYPTQIHEALQLYSQLVADGYTAVSLMGGSAGGNLALAISRYIAYPGEAKKHFLQFADFEFDFGPLPQPAALLLLSPWVQPASSNRVPTKYGIDITGDLGSKDPYMGECYLGGVSKESTIPWVTFSETSFDKHWAKVEPIVEAGRTLVICGEREVLREGIETFMEIVNSGGHVEYALEKGGVHDCLAYVESLDYLGASGCDKAVRGDFKDKFCFNHVVRYLERIVGENESR